MKPGDDELDHVDPALRSVVATYNIHRAVGRDGASDPQRVADVLAEIGAPVIAPEQVPGAPLGPQRIRIDGAFGDVSSAAVAERHRSARRVRPIV